MQEAGILQIASEPAVYSRYLDVQGDNPQYSPGNIALAMVQDPEIGQFGTADRWRQLGRRVLDIEKNNGVQIFSRGTFGKGYVLADAYDVSQTYGRDLKELVIQDHTTEMDNAVVTLLNYSVVPVTVIEDLPVPAYYDAQKMELQIRPGEVNGEAFASIATEIAHCRFHGKGVNQLYDRAECHLDAESVSYLLCRRFQIPREKPDLSRLGEAYGEWSPTEIRAGLDAIQSMGKRVGNSLEQAITPQQHTRSSQTQMPGR